MNQVRSPLSIVVMGVSGCGKSTVAEALAEKLNGHFIDGDDFHPPENVERMSKGIPLTDADRMPWLAAINHSIRQPQTQPKTQPQTKAKTQPGRVVKVVACSALKRVYRDALSDSVSVLFVHLAGDFELIEARSNAREGHFMDVDLLQSQFDTLETPNDDEPVVTVSIDAPIDAVVDNVVQCVKQSSLFQSFQQQNSGGQ